MRFGFLKQKKSLLAVFIVLLILVYNFTALGVYGSRLQPVFYYLGSPFWRAGRGLNSAWAGLTGGWALQAKLAKSEDYASALAAENARLNFLRDENRELRELLGFKASSSQEVLAASVMAWSDFSGQSIIIINQGSEAGVLPRLPVISSGGVLIGKVASVTPGTATVLLTVDNNSSIAASLAKDSAVQAIVKGKTGLSLSLDLLPQDAVIAVGDIVVTSALEDNTPAGLVIGKVAAVFYKDGELFKRANLEPIVSLPNIKIVGVIKTVQ